MGKLEEEVRELINSRYGNLASFARRIGLPERTLYSALRRGLHNTAFATIIPICTELGIDPADIARGELSFAADKPKPAFVPLYGFISAGKPLEMQDYEDVFPIPASLHDAHPDAFMLRVEGNSMNRVLPDGFLVLIEPCESVDVSGQIYAVTVGACNATVKRVILHDNGITLQPDSSDPTYRPQLFDYSQPENEPIVIIGRVVWWCSPVAVPRA